MLWRSRKDGRRFLDRGAAVDDLYNRDGMTPRPLAVVTVAQGASGMSLDVFEMRRASTACLVGSHSTVTFDAALLDGCVHRHSQVSRYDFPGTASAPGLAGCASWHG